jgi:hypothetical protein
MRLIPRAAIVRRVSGPPNATLKPLKLETLAPEFSEVHHGTYLSALERAIDHQPTARNIALAGAYGVGKSSVLGEFAKRRRKRVIKASLLTLGLEPEASDEGLEANPAARTTSNRRRKSSSSCSTSRARRGRRSPASDASSVPACGWSCQSP